MNKYTKISIAVVVLLAIAFGAYYFLRPQENLGVLGKPKVTDISSASSTFTGIEATSTALYSVLGNISYGLKDPQTKLTKGYFLGKFEDCGGASCQGVTYYSHMKLESNIAEGDIDGDGIKDAVVVVSSGTTNSPSIEGVKYTKQDVAAVLNKGGVYKNVAAIELSDDLGAKTTSIQSISIKDGVIYATVIKNQGVNDPKFPVSKEVVKLIYESASASGFNMLK